MRRQTVWGERQNAFQDRQSITTMMHSLIKCPSVKSFICWARKRDTIAGECHLSASAVCLRRSEVLYCRLPESLTMTSFLSAADIDAKLDAWCCLSKWRCTLYSLRTVNLQANEALGLSKAFSEKVFLRVGGPTLKVHFFLLKNCRHDDFQWCFCGKDLSHTNLPCAIRRSQVERCWLTHLVG